MLGQDRLGEMILGQNVDSTVTYPEWLVACQGDDTWANLWKRRAVTVYCDEHQLPENSEDSEDGNRSRAILSGPR